MDWTGGKIIVSFIVPVYNAETLLPRCIKSLVSQEGFLYEIIIVNDGSTDKSGQVAEEYRRKDNRVKVIHQENAGVSEARNAGIVAAKGEWLFFVDADDYIDSSFANTISRDQDMDVDLILYGYYEEYPRKSILRGAPEYDAQRLDREAIDLLKNNAINRKFLAGDPLMRLNAGSVWGHLIRTRLVRENDIRFPNGISWGEDGIFMYSVFKNASSAFVSTLPVYHYCIVEGSVTHSYRPNMPEIAESLIQGLRQLVGDGAEEQALVQTRMVIMGVSCVLRYYCHPKNKEPYSARKKKFLQIIGSDPYRTAFFNDELQGFSTLEKIACMLIKRQCFFVLNILVKAYQVFGG